MKHNKEGENANNQRLVLVTGGAGYKGSTLCKELLNWGYKVRVIDNLMYGGGSLSAITNHERFEFCKGDVTDSKALDYVLDGVTDIIHLAAIVGDKPCERDPKLSIDVNLKATQMLVEKAIKNKINRFIFASTCSNYGVADTATPADEERELNPVSLYAETKIDCERFIKEKATVDGFTSSCLRFSTAFGLSGRTRFDLTVNSFTYEAIRDKRLLVYAEESWRPFIHVLDMARIYNEFLTLPQEKINGGIFNAGWNEQNYMKKEIVNMIRKVIGDFEVDYVNTIEDLRSYRVDFAKIQNIIDIEPVMSVEAGIREIAEAIQGGVLTEKDFQENKLK